MSQAPHRVCPACGTRNKPTWEFCVRCGESIAEVAVERVAATESGARPSGRAKPALVTGPRADQGVGWGWWAGVALLLPMAVFACQWYGRGETTPTPPPAGTFIAATPQPERAPAAPPPGADVYADAVRLMREGDLAGASRVFEEAVELEPDNASYRKTYGDCLSQLGRASDAIDQYAAAARAAPDAPMFARVWAEALEQQGRFGEAAQAYEEALAAHPEDVSLWRSLAHARRSEGNLEASASALRRAVELLPNDPRVGYELGVALDAAGDHAAAAQAFQAIIDANPRAVAAYTGLAESYFQQGRTDDALRALDNGIEVDPAFPLLRRTRGSILERAKRPREAAREYREYARLAPNASDAATLVERAEQLEASSR